MEPVDEVLAELDVFLNKVWEDAKAEGVKKANLVIVTRRDLLDKISKLHSVSLSDPKFTACPEIFIEFKERLMRLRHDLARLNSRWRADNLAASFSEYSAESRPIAEECARFVQWARGARMGL